MQVVNIQSIKGPDRTKKWKKGEFASFLTWDIHLLLLDTGTPGSQAFGLWDLH